MQLYLSYILGLGYHTSHCRDYFLSLLTPSSSKSLITSKIFFLQKNCTETWSHSYSLKDYNSPT